MNKCRLMLCSMLLLTGCIAQADLDSAIDTRFDARLDARILPTLQAKGIDIGSSTETVGGDKTDGSKIGEQAAGKTAVGGNQGITGPWLAGCFMAYLFASKGTNLALAWIGRKLNGHDK